jgi:hypothetical protein
LKKPLEGWVLFERENGGKTVLGLCAVVVVVVVVVVVGYHHQKKYCCWL